MSSNDQLVNAYFKSWREHDVEALSKIFTVDCEYHIKDKPSLNGLHELQVYWNRNKDRQRELDVFDPIVFEATADATKVAFCATFLDSEEKQNQTVFGEITFFFKDGKISRLTESYRVHRERSNFVFWETVGKFWLRIRIGSQNLLQNQLPRILQVTSVILALSAFFYSYNVNRLPDFVVCALNGTFGPSGCDLAISGNLDAMTATAHRYLSLLGGTLLLIIPFVSKYSARLQFGRVRTTELIRDRHDLEIMRKSFKNAKGLTIFSGDFSFVKDNEDFFPIFRRLSNRKSLNIISDASKESVIAGFGGTKEARGLIEELEAEGRILFNSPTPIKCSIVRKWDGSEVLYRFDGNGAGAASSHLYMCEVRDRGDIGPVVKLIEHLSKARLRG